MHYYAWVFIALLLWLCSLSTNISALEPVDSLYYSGLVNNICYHEGKLLAATDSGIVDLDCGNFLAHEPMNTVCVYQNFYWTVSVAGTLKQWDFNFNEYFHCALTEPDAAPEVLVSLCYPTVLLNYAGTNMNGLWDLLYYPNPSCSLMNQHGIIPIGYARLRGLAFSQGHFWIGEWQTCKLYQLTISDDWALVTQTLDFPGYGERLLGFTGRVDNWWVAFQRGDSTVVIHFTDDVSTPKLEPRKPMEYNLQIWPNPVRCFLDVVEPREFAAYNMLGRRVPREYDAPTGLYILVAQQKFGKLMIVR